MSGADRTFDELLRDIERNRRWARAALKSAELHLDAVDSDFEELRKELRRQWSEAPSQGGRPPLEVADPEKAERLFNLMIRNPEASDFALGQMVGADPKTVNSFRKRNWLGQAGS